MPTLNFDEASHVYTVGGHRLPSVTQIIRFGGEETDYSHIPDWILKRAAEIGISVHEIVSYFYTSHGNLISDDKSVRNYLAGFRKFTQKESFVCERSELMLWCPCHLIAGTVDLIGYLNGELGVYDLKTTKKINEAHVELQTAAYQHLAETFFAGTELASLPNRGIIHLKKTKTYALHPCEDDSAWTRFEGMIDEYWEANGGKPELG